MTYHRFWPSRSYGRQGFSRICFGQDNSVMDLPQSYALTTQQKGRSAWDTRTLLSADEVFPHRTVGSTRVLNLLETCPSEGLDQTPKPLWATAWSVVIDAHQRLVTRLK